MSTDHEPQTDQGELPAGIRLRRTLFGHTGKIARVAWSPDGNFLASTCTDGMVRIWQPETGKLIHKLTGHKTSTFGIAWSPDGTLLASGDSDGTMRLWSTQTGEVVEVIKNRDRGRDKIRDRDRARDKDQVTSIAWSPDGRTLAFGSGAEIFLLNPHTRADATLIPSQASFGRVWSLAWSADSRRLAASRSDGRILLWENESLRILQTLNDKRISTYSVAWSADGTTLVTASEDRTIRLWEYNSGRLLSTLEGHTGVVCWAGFSPDQNVLASKSQDGTIRFWKSGSWEIIGTLLEETDSACYFFASPSFHPILPVLASFGEADQVIRIWDLDTAELVRKNSDNPPTTVSYTTAKIVLVGDSGVGKTGLGWRLAHGRYREHDSTHGQQFWVIEELVKERSDGTRCEAVLWDLAGQPDYRLVHSLFLDNVDLALVLFDPTNRQEPLSGPSFWLKQLRRSDGVCPTLLVGARLDRGSPTLTEAELQTYCRQYGISGGFIATSAKTGEGFPALIAAIQTQIHWDHLTSTIATTTFKRIKEFVLSLKERTTVAGVLLSPGELLNQLRDVDPEWDFDETEMMTAVRHLATHGYVSILHSSHGEKSILLAPDLLTNLASSFVLEARRNPRGLGVLEEDRLLHGDYPFPELAQVTASERTILLDATTMLFLERNVCFRETFNDQIFLVFPSLINERRPVAEETIVLEDVSYRVSGAVENVYASLVVLLGYTNTFTRTNQWQNQAQYQMGEGEVCGFRQTASRDGEIELVLLYSIRTPEYVRSLFQGLFERFLSRRNLTISRYLPVACTSCGERLARNVVLQQLQRDRKFSFCSNCGERLALPELEDLTAPPLQEEGPIALEQAVVARRTAFEAALVRVKALLRDSGSVQERPTCFISYAWGDVSHERWVMKLAADLRNAGIDVLLDRWHNPPGSSLSRYLEQITSSRYVVIVATPALREKYMASTSDPVVATELRLIHTRIRQPTRFGPTVIPLLLAGNAQTALTPTLEDLVAIDFVNEELYFVNIFNLIWRLFELPFDNPLLLDLQASMNPHA